MECCLASVFDIDLLSALVLTASPVDNILEMRTLYFTGLVCHVVIIWSCIFSYTTKGRVFLSVDYSTADKDGQV